MAPLPRIRSSPGIFWRANRGPDLRYGSSEGSRISRSRGRMSDAMRINCESVAVSWVSLLNRSHSKLSAAFKSSLSISSRQPRTCCGPKHQASLFQMHREIFLNAGTPRTPGSLASSRAWPGTHRRERRALPVLHCRAEQVAWYRMVRLALSSKWAGSCSPSLVGAAFGLNSLFAS